MAQLTSAYCYITSTATKTALMTLLSLLVFVSALPVAKRQTGTQDLEAFGNVRGGMDVMDYVLEAGSTQASSLAKEVTCNIYNHYTELGSEEGALKVITEKLLEQSCQWLMSTQDSGVTNCGIGSDLSIICSDENVQNKIRSTSYKNYRNLLDEYLQVDGDSISIPSLVAWLRENIPSSDPVWAELCQLQVFSILLSGDECD